MDTDTFFADDPTPTAALTPDAEGLLRRLRSGELIPPPAATAPGHSSPVEPEADFRRRRLRDVLAERLPVAMRGAHLDPALRGALGLGVVALVAALAALGLAWRSAPRPVASAAPPAVSAVALPAGGAVPSAAATAADASPGPVAGGVVVDVAGKVRHPGVVSLPAGSRVADALDRAGGVLPGTDTSALSLARKVADGEQILVTGKPGTAAAPVGPGSAGASPSPAGAADPGAAAGVTGAGGTGQPLDLNAATVDQLDALPGVGPVLAGRIVEYRTAHNGFTSVDQLREVKGLGGKIGEQLLPLVRVG